MRVQLLSQAKVKASKQRMVEKTLDRSLSVYICITDIHFYTHTCTNTGIIFGPASVWNLPFIWFFPCSSISFRYFPRSCSSALPFRRFILGLFNFLRCSCSSFFIPLPIYYVTCNKSSGSR